MLVTRSSGFWSDTPPGVRRSGAEEAEVRSLHQREQGGFLLETSDGPRGRGTRSRAGRPVRSSARRDFRAARRFLRSCSRSTPRTTRVRPTARDGPVLVVGERGSPAVRSRKSSPRLEGGHLSCGRAPWLPRRIGEHDFVWWLYETGFVEATVDSLLSPERVCGGTSSRAGRMGGTISICGHCRGKKSCFSVALSVSTAGELGSSPICPKVSPGAISAISSSASSSIRSRRSAESRSRSCPTPLHSSVMRVTPSIEGLRRDRVRRRVSTRLRVVGPHTGRVR